MVLGKKSHEQHPAGMRAFIHEASGKRLFGRTKEEGKDHMKKGLETLMNRSELKGIVDHTERSRALGADITKKLTSMENATGKKAADLLKMIGEKA